MFSGTPREFFADLNGRRMDLMEKLPSIWPLFPSLKNYKKKFLAGDLTTGLVMAAVTAPQALGFAVIIGLPVVTGLYSAMLAPLIFAMFTSSKRLIVGPDTATATIIAAGASVVAVAGTAGYVHAVAVLCVVVALILIAMAYARFGFLADLISAPVLTGFLAGVGLQLLVGKLPSMLHLPAQAGFFDKLTYIAEHFTQIHWISAAIAATVVVFILLSAKLVPKLPAFLIALVGATVVAVVFHLDSYGVALIGPSATGLPSWSWPSFHFRDIIAIIGSALSIVIVIIAQSAATSRSYAVKNNEKVDDNQDFLALGLANASSVAIGGFAITGSPSRTAISEKAGGRSQIVNISMTVFIALLTLVASGMLQYIPVAAMSAIVFTIGIYIINVGELRSIFVARRTEFMVAMVAMIVVALVSIQMGVILAVIISLADRLRRQYHPSDQILMRDRKLSPWAREILGEKTRPVPGVLVYRFSDSIFFENTTYFISRLTEALESSKEPVRLIIIQADAINDIDFTAAQAIIRFTAQVNEEGMRVAFSHVTPELHKIMDQYGLTEIIRDSNIHPTLHSILNSLPVRQMPCAELVKELKLKNDSYAVVGGALLEVLGLRETVIVDILVDGGTYEHYLHEGWRQADGHNGTKVLYRGHYKMLEKWGGKTLADIKDGIFELEGVEFIGFEDFKACKRARGRKQDIKDIELIEAWKPDARQLAAMSNR